MTSKILGVSVNPTNYISAVQQILSWARTATSHVVIAANVHILMEAHDSEQFCKAVNSADLVTPDGMPLVWLLRFKGYPGQQRVYGPTLMLHVLEAAARERIPVGFYGSSPEVMQSLLIRMKEKYPTLVVAYSFSPPFRETSEAEDAEIVKSIRGSAASILFIGLGCPKQEKWMTEHRAAISAVMLGVGAAFDFHAGSKPQAPSWIQKIGLEWLYRLLVEPRRLWRRYLHHNPRFIFLAIADLLGFLG